jgi:hypothetical protein
MNQVTCTQTVNFGKEKPGEYVGEQPIRLEGIDEIIYELSYTTPHILAEV